MDKNEIVLFESKDGKVALPVSVGVDTVWLTQDQMSQLFGRSQPVIARHINNAFKDGEVDREVAYAKFAYTTRHGALADRTQTKEVGLYNLDVIISVGYRVKSQRGVEFRRWATSVLREYLIKGAAINQNRLRLRRRRPRIFCILSRRITASRTVISALLLVSFYIS